MSSPLYRNLVASFVVVCMALMLAPATAQADDRDAALDVLLEEADRLAREGAEELLGRPSVTPTVVGWLELSGELPDGPPPFAWVSEQDAGATLRMVLRQLRTVAASDRHRGIVIWLNQPQLSLTQIDEIALAMQQVRDSGKRVIVYAEQFTLPTYVLACAADTILLHRKGQLQLTGLGTEEIYLAGLLEQVGVRADLIQVGRYKGADETFTRRQPSEAWSENIDSLLDDLYGQVVARIAAGREMTPKEVEEALAGSLAMTDEQYIAAGLIDGLTDFDMAEASTQVFGEVIEWDENMGSRTGRSGPQVDNPFALFTALFAPPPRPSSRHAIALINAAGPITSGQSQFGDGLFTSERIGSGTMVDALTEAREDPRIKGVVIRLDSPGGSAIASEMIWQAVRQTAAEKPVFVTVGSMAASGGYYIACAADQVYVTPATIVGSIGVVGGKLVLGDLYEKIGIGVHVRSRGPLGDMFSSVEPFSEEQRQVLLASMQQVYDLFKDRVSIGRGDRIDDVEAVAQGRLFTGRQAIELGMADHLGGVHDAMTAMAEQLNLEPGSYDVRVLPAPMNMGEFLEQLFGMGVRSPQGAVSVNIDPAVVQALRALLGEQGFAQLARSVTGIMQLREESVLTLMPAVIVVR